MSVIKLNPYEFLGTDSFSATDTDKPIGQDETSEVYAQFAMNTGGAAQTSAFYSVEKIEIPDNAVINSVSCTAKVQTSNSSIVVAGNNYLQIYSGSTLKARSDVWGTKNATTITVSSPEWTLDEINELKIAIFGSRGYLQTSSSQWMRFYGATVTIEYTEPSGNRMYVKIGNTWTECTGVYKKINGVWVAQDDYSAVFDANVKYIKTEAQ
ncbi:MAG: hypothetical protein ACI4XJ_08895 [Eubacteriales bacterium]